MRCIKYICFLVIIITCCTHKAQAQACVDITDSGGYTWIGKSVYYIIDTNKALTFEQISSPAFKNRFTRCKQESPNFGNIELPVWNRFTIINNTAQRLVLTEWNTSMDSLLLYYKDKSGGWQCVKSGKSINHSYRPYASNLYVFDLPVQANDTATFYLKVRSYITQYPLTVSTIRTFIDSSYYNILFKGLYIGFVLLVLFNNITLFYSFRDKSFIYSIIWNITIVLTITELNGTYGTFIGSRVNFLWSYGPSIIAINTFFLTLLSQSLLRLREQMPAVNKWVTRFRIIVPLIIIPLNLLGKNLAASLINQMMALIIPVILITLAIILLRRGYRPARFL